MRGLALVLVLICACSKEVDARQEMRRIRFHQLETAARMNALTPRQRQLLVQIESVSTMTNERKLDSLLDLATR